MHGFLGAEPVNPLEVPKFAQFGTTDWAMLFVSKYGQFDGLHHKAWVLDQVARILKGTPVLVTLARWENGEHEYRFETGEPSQAYLDWVDQMRGKHEPNGTREYGYYEGTPP
jgi:hypothetical protein